jgi:hypothetical protein
LFLIDWVKDRMGISEEAKKAKLNNFPICFPVLYHNILGECGEKIYLGKN